MTREAADALAEELTRQAAERGEDVKYVVLASTQQRELGAAEVASFYVRRGAPREA